MFSCSPVLLFSCSPVLLSPQVRSCTKGSIEDSERIGSDCHQPLCMYPAQCVLQNVELASVITHDHQITTKTMGQQTTEQRPFGGNPDVLFAADVLRVQTLKQDGFIVKCWHVKSYTSVKL